MKTKKMLIWILLFGTLIGINESVIGSLHIPYKSLVLSALTLFILTVSRSMLERTGTSLLIVMVAVLFKITDMGIFACKPFALLLIGISFEIFATLFTLIKTGTKWKFQIVNFLTAMVAFVVFALAERYIFENGYWLGNKFTDYLTVKAPLTAVVSALLSLPALIVAKALPTAYNKLLPNRLYLVNGTIGLFIIACWLTAFFTR